MMTTGCSVRQAASKTCKEKIEKPRGNTEGERERKSTEKETLTTFSVQLEKGNFEKQNTELLPLSFLRWASGKEQIQKPWH